MGTKRTCWVIATLALLVATGCRGRTGADDGGGGAGGLGGSAVSCGDQVCDTGLCSPATGECVECLSDLDCDCHRGCSDDGECVPLGAPDPELAQSAHGNWAGTPGTEDYVFTGDCIGDDECPFGQICSAFTNSCLPAGDLVDCLGSNDCPAGLQCEPGRRKCLPPALCYSDHGCCGQPSFTCRGAGEESAGLCVNLECTPPDTVTLTCPLTPKLTNECSDELFCSLDGRCVECSCDGDCNDANAPKCHVGSSTCRPSSYCTVSADCAINEACDSRTRTCQPYCEDTCAAGFECDDSDHVCRCAADIYSPNGSSGEAAPFTAPAIGETLNLNGTLCGGFESDWFAVTLQRGDKLELDASTLSELAADLFAFDAGLGTLASSSDMTQGIEFTADVDGTYYIRVRHTAGSGDYRLTVVKEIGEVCDEGGANNLPNSALPLNGPGGVALGCVVSEGSLDAAHEVTCIDSMRLCSADVDFFTVYGQPGTGIEVEVGNFSGDIDLYLYGPFASEEDVELNTPIVSSTSSTADPEVLSYFNRAGGIYLVRVRGSSGTVSAYDLTVTVGVATSAVCEEDSFDAVTAAPVGLDDAGFNDSASTASGWPLGQDSSDSRDLSLCRDDADWFVLGHPSGDDLVGFELGERLKIDIVDVTPGPASKLLLFVGTDADEVAAAAVAQTSKKQSINLNGGGGLLYAAVVPLAGEVGAHTYRLQASIESPPACDLDDLGDVAEGNRNDTPATAYELQNPPWPADLDDDLFTFGGTDDAVISLCEADMDWYKISMPATEARVSATVAYTDGTAELGLALYKKSVLTVLSTTPGVAPQTGRVDSSEVDGTGLQQVRGEIDETAYLLVYNRSNWPLPSYSLGVEFIETACPTDAWEDNNNASQAPLVQLTPSATEAGVEDAVVTDLTLCGAFDDWYRVHMGPGDRIDVTVPYVPDEGIMELSLYDGAADGQLLVLDADGAETGVLSLSYTVGSSAHPQDYYIRLHPDGGNENFYSLQVDVSRQCVDDRYSPATSNSPYAVDVSVETVADGNLRLCDDADVYTVRRDDEGPISLCARFVHADVDIDIDVVGDGVNLKSTTKEDYEELSFTAAADTEYTVRVFRDFRSDWYVEYGLWLLADAGGCPDACADGIQNGDETDTDCGGSCTNRCTAGYRCEATADCDGGLTCNLGICQ